MVDNKYNDKLSYTRWLHTWYSKNWNELEEWSGVWFLNVQFKKARHMKCVWLFAFLFLDEDGGTHFHLVVKPAYVFIMHPYTTCRHVLADRVGVVVSMYGVRVANSTVHFHINAEPAIPKRIARVSSLDAFLVVRSVLHFFVNSEQAFRRIGGFFACSDGKCFYDLTFFIIRQFVGGFINDDKLCVLGVLTVQLLSGSALGYGGEKENQQ